MLTKKVKNRIIFLISSILIGITLTFLILKTLNNNLLYFRSPTDIAQNESITTGKKMRIGGMVKKIQLRPIVKK